ncbi:mucoidy inhibitor MuiA family protein [Rhodobacterales bacterium LSUCC0031]|nr:mucoidy inhibitor MuiA family protein [Rhodobacterales bacterium LSUCC0031]
MRIALSLVLSLMGAAPALADDILLNADITAATIYLSGAEVSRTAQVALAPGTHQVVIAMPDAAQAERILLSAPAGMTIGQPRKISSYPVAEGALDDAEQAAARAARDVAEAALIAAQDALALVDGDIQALEMQLRFLGALAGEGIGDADPDRLSQFMTTLGAQAAQLERSLHQARIARREPAKMVADRMAALAAAQDALDRRAPFGRSVDAIAFPLSAQTAVTGQIRLDYFTHAASWSPSYELRLDSATGALDIAPFISVAVQGAGQWRDVAMRFATTQPDRPRTPSALWPNPARIAEPVEVQPFALSRLGAAPMMEAATDAIATPEMTGLSVTHVYARPVTLDATGQAILPLDPVQMQTTTEIRAVPRLDQIAYLVATLRHTSGAPILPGQARYFRDGALIGEDWLPLIPVGAEAELGFGPLDHLRLIWIDRSLAEGDRGLFTSSTTQDRAIAFGVENTSDTAETVRVIYATPFSEQEDLALDLTLAPAPDARDRDDRRGVHAWNLTVQPGQTALVEMGVSLAWPEGQMLLWQP